MDYRDNRSGGGSRGPKKFGGGGGGYSGGGGRSFGRPSFGARDRDDRPMMHKAICDECNDRCEVPFKPTGERPVLCNDCFRKDGPRNDRRGGERSFGERSFDKPRSRDRDERPRDRDVDAPKPMNKGNESIEQLKERVELLNTKLDKILKMITPVATKEAQEEALATVAPVKVKKAKVKKEKATVVESES